LISAQSDVRRLKDHAFLRFLAWFFKYFGTRRPQVRVLSPRFIRIQIDRLTPNPEQFNLAVHRAHRRRAAFQRRLMADRIRRRLVRTRTLGEQFIPMDWHENHAGRNIVINPRGRPKIEVDKG
jgi:hypothetical protein